jgi:hypothetical protein
VIVRYLEEGVDVRNFQKQTAIGNSPDHCDRFHFCYTHFVFL